MGPAELNSCASVSAGPSADVVLALSVFVAACAANTLRDASSVRHATDVGRRASVELGQP